MRSFQQQYAPKYTSTFSSEPASRPSYIPQSTVVNGNTYNIYYDQSHGGYGYWSNGAWTAYSVMRDAVMLNALMHQHNYYYDGAPYAAPYGYGGPTYYHTSSSGGIWSGLLCVLFLIIAAFVIARIFGF